MIEKPMSENSITFNCYFMPLGMESDRNPLFASFKNEPHPEELILFMDNKEIGNYSDIDFKRYSLRPVVGYIKNGEKIYKNAKVNFVKKGEKHFSRVYADTCYTNSAGMYKAYITPGIYDIEVIFNNNKYVNKDQEIKNGLAYPFYIFTKAAIKNHVKDTVTFTNSDYIYISNYLKDEADRPLPNAEIVVYDESYIYAYVLTNKDGRYTFSLKPGKYNVLIREENRNVKHSNVEINEILGFDEQLKRSNLFSKEAMILL